MTKTFYQASWLNENNARVYSEIGHDRGRIQITIPANAREIHWAMPQAETLREAKRAGDLHEATPRSQWHTIGALPRREPRARALMRRHGARGAHPSSPRPTGVAETAR